MQSLILKLKKVRPEIGLFSALIILLNLHLFAGNNYGTFVYTSAGIDSGEWWRALTFPFVHVSWWHLLLDAGAFLFLLQGLQETSILRRISYIVACAAGSLGLSLATSPLDGGLCGLSGIAHGLMAITGLELIRSSDQILSKAGWTCLIVILGKSIYEAITGQIAFQFLHLGSVGQPIAACHLGGVIGGIISYGVFRCFSRSSRIHSVEPKEPLSVHSDIKTPHLKSTSALYSPAEGGI